jgi:hypothetical protein
MQVTAQALISDTPPSQVAPLPGHKKAAAGDSWWRRLINASG